MVVNLVLGSAGLVGRSLCKYLKNIGEEVIEYDIKYSQDQDLRRSKLDLSGIDKVYFLAWDVGGAKYLYRPDTQEHQLQWNLRILQNTIPQLGISKIPFLFVSTQLHNLKNAYGVGKTVGEYWTRLYSNGKVVRLWNIYGEIETHNERSHVIADIIEQALKNGKINLLTDGKEHRYFVFEEDACHGFTMAIESLQTDKTYDIAGPEPISIIEVASIVSRLTGAKLTTVNKKSDTYTNGDQPNYLPGYLPKVRAIKGIEIMLKRYQKLLNI